MVLEIRKLLPMDFHLWKIIRHEARADEGLEFLAEAKFSDNQWVGYLTNNFCFVAVDSKVGVIGCGVMFQGHEVVKKHLGYVFNIYVKPELRRKGVMTKLLENMLAYGKGLGMEQIHLTVLANNNAAIEGYKKMGFYIYGAHPRSVKLSTHYEDEILLMKEI